MNNNKAFDLSSFKLRADEYFKLSARSARSWYDSEGNWLLSSTPQGTREGYWLCFALYSQGAGDLADAIIRVSKTHGVAKDGTADSSFNIFHSNIACILLVQHRDKMAPDVRAKLEGLVRESLMFLPGNRQPDYQFHGYNDNMPAKATMGLILGGEMLGDDDAIQHGLWGLHTLRNMLFRRGINSEFNSPTYTPLTIHAMGEIVHCARNEEARVLARKIEERLWLDLSARFHPEIGIIAGPHSRAYNADTIAHISCVSALLWFVLGNSSRPSPLEVFDPKHPFVLHHKGDVPFNVSQLCWFASGNYHVPARAESMFTSKTYPFRVMATSEAGDAGPDSPAEVIRAETYLQKDYTVGTCTTHWLGGEQSMPYFVTYKKADNVGSFRDIGTIFHKLTVNEDVPGAIKFNTDANGNPYSNSGEQDNLESKCHLISLQSDETVLLLTQPAVTLGGLDDLQKPRLITRLNEMIIFPSHFSGADEIRIGAREIAQWSGQVGHGEWIGCRRGKLLIAIRPMAYTDGFGEPVVTLEKINNYEVLRTTFYNGAERTFTRSELRKIFGGYVIEHASMDEYPSLAAFLEDLSKTLFTDFLFTTRRMRYRRPESKVRPALELEISSSPDSRQTRFMLINGVPVAQDIPVQIDGLKNEDFPILSEPWVSVPSYFPWKDTCVPWLNIKAIIGDQEAL